jgi:hypothetical protein
VAKIQFFLLLRLLAAVVAVAIRAVFMPQNQVALVVVELMQFLHLVVRKPLTKDLMAELVEAVRRTLAEVAVELVKLDLLQVAL